MKNSPKEFEGKLVVVTGGTRGIGLAIATLFDELGAKVIKVGKSKAGKKDIVGYYQCDFEDEPSLQLLAKFLKNKKPDILINNAGININSSFDKIKLSDFMKIQKVNIVAPLLLSQAVLPSMKSRGWGRIVNISSIWGKVSKSERASYSSSKFAIDGMTLALALEYAKWGVLANCVSPGFTDTELTQKNLGPKGIKEVLKSVPMGRMAKASEIAELVVWLASEKNSYVTGQNYVIDGGFSRA